MQVPWIEVDAAFADAWNRQFEALRGVRGLDGRHGLRAFDGFAPTVTEGPDGVTRWVADLPGVRREDLSVKLENGTLTVEVKRDTAAPAGWTTRHSERAPFELRRTFRIADDHDQDAVVATLDNGVLTVSLPRRARTTRTIEVRTV